MHNQTNYPFIMMRHGESQHNFKKGQVKRKSGLSKPKELPEYKALKFNLSLRDPPLTQKGISQCQEVTSSLQWSNIDIILVSPLIRCLETCERMISHLQRKPKVIVVPLLASRMNYIWSVGSDVEELKKKFPLFQFSEIEKYEIWELANLPEEKAKQVHTRNQLIEGLQKGIFQTYDQFRGRLVKIKQCFEKWRQQTREGQRTLIISHSCLLKAITAIRLKENKKAVGLSEFENGTPVFLQPSALFKLLQCPKL